MTIDRRELFPILAAASVASAQHDHHRPALVSTDAYKLQVFTPQQNRILDVLADLIIPADAHSGGAHDARVSQYMDLVAHHVAPVRKALESALAELDLIAQKTFSQPLAALDRAQMTGVLEAAPEALLEMLKSHTVEGYRLSYIGQTQWMGYKPHPPGLYPDHSVDGESVGK